MKWRTLRCHRTATRLVLSSLSPSRSPLARTPQLALAALLIVPLRTLVDLLSLYIARNPLFSQLARACDRSLSLIQCSPLPCGPVAARLGSPLLHPLVLAHLADLLLISLCRCVMSHPSANDPRDSSDSPAIGRETSKIDVAADCAPFTRSPPHALVGATRGADAVHGGRGRGRQWIR